jgi:hypothetical protein
MKGIALKLSATDARIALNQGMSTPFLQEDIKKPYGTIGWTSLKPINA